MGKHYLVVVWVLWGGQPLVAQETAPTPADFFTPGAEEYRPDGEELTFEAGDDGSWFGLQNYVIAAFHWVLEPFAVFLLDALGWIGLTDSVTVSIDLSGGTIGWWTGAANCYVPLTELLLQAAAAMAVYSILILLRYSHKLLAVIS